jgi:hypothetical protein
MKTRTLVLVSAAVASAVVTVSVARAELKKGKIIGRSLMVATVLDSTKLANGTTVRHTHSRGFTVSNDPGSPFDGASEDVLLSDVLAADGTVISITASGDGVDRDGDTWSFVSGTQPGTWVYVGGTGKFKGIEGGGTYKVEKEWPDGRTIFSWEGTIK